MLCILMIDVLLLLQFDEVSSMSGDMIWHMVVLSMTINRHTTNRMGVFYLIAGCSGPAKSTAN